MSNTIADAITRELYETLPDARQMLAQGIRDTPSRIAPVRL